jgi:hypothetical protein
VVGVAQLVEHRVVAPVVEGSNPFTHPIFFEFLKFGFFKKKICARSSAG